MELPLNKALFVLFALLTIIFAMMTPLIPMAFKKKGLKKDMENSKLEEKNIEVWGRVPGKLKSALEHTFQFYDYSGISEQTAHTLPLKNKVVYKEDLEYQLQSQANNEITVKANRTYELVTNETESKVKMPSLGFYEFIHTLSHPPTYQKGINVLKYLSEFANGPYHLFERKIFALKNEEMLTSEDRVKEVILNGLPDEMKNIIYSDAEHGFTKIQTAFQWVKMAGVQEFIQKATWLKDKFELTDDQIKLVLGENSALTTTFSNFLNDLAGKEGCIITGDADTCHFVYKQLAEGTFLEHIELGEIKTFKALDEALEESEFQFDSPEMNFYYQILGTEIPFDDIKLTGDQLYTMLDLKSKDSFLSPNNMGELLSSNSLKDFTKMPEVYQIKSNEQLDFITSYIMSYLPSIYINLRIEGSPSYISDSAKSYVRFIQDYIKETSGKIYEKRGIIYGFIISPWLKQQFPDDEMEDVCAMFLKRAVEDPMKVRRICRDEYFDFGKPRAMARWIMVQDCYLGSKENCDQDLLAEFKKKAVLSDSELSLMYDWDEEISFSWYLKEGMNYIFNWYCGSEVCSDRQIADMQFTNAKITLDPPTELGLVSADTLNTWDNESFPEPLELSYIQHQQQINDTVCSEKARDALAKLYSTDNDYFSDEYKKTQYKNKINIESMTTLYLEDIYPNPFATELEIEYVPEFYDFILKLVREFTFNDTYLKDYDSFSVLLGNNQEDKKYVEMLAAGAYYDNYKPGLNSTTGFNIKLAEKPQNDGELDEYTFCTKDEKDKDILRKITKINGKSFFNVKKKEYSAMDQQIVTVDSPFYNSALVADDNNWVSDGYQFSAETQKNHLYYFDELSGRKLKFDYKEETTHNGMTCRNYVLNTDFAQGLSEEDMGGNQNAGTVYHMFNKPLVISTEKNPFEKFVHQIQMTNQDSFVCVDPFSSMVIDSNIHLVYAINSHGYKLFNEEVEEGFLPIISYNRHYSVNKNAYKGIFKQAKKYKTARIVTIVLGIFFTAVCLNLTVFFYMMRKREAKAEESVEQPQQLLPDNFRTSEVNVNPV